MYVVYVCICLLLVVRSSSLACRLQVSNRQSPISFMSHYEKLELNSNKVFCYFFVSSFTLSLSFYFSLSLSPYLNNSTIPTYDVIQLLLCCQVYISKILYYAVAWHFIFIQWHPYMLHKCCIVNGITSALQYGTIIELYLYYMWHEMVRPLSASFAWTIVWRI